MSLPVSLMNETTQQKFVVLDVIVAAMKFLLLKFRDTHVSIARYPIIAESGRDSGASSSFN